ncbi:MAG: Glu-tRNA(Gln) amidotransferase subunit GatD [bacterium]|nr:Glu-tRNA(Gln) amidotransferase subunit GatD [bacterium]
MQEPNPGDYVEIQLHNGKILKGIVMPRSELDTTDVLILKLDNGYNIGIRKDKIARIEIVKKYSIEKEVERVVQRKEGLPVIGMFATGGTIGSRVDYATGAVTAKYSAADILDLVPEIADIANVEGHLIFNMLSENLTPAHWIEIARKISEHLDEYYGIVITHGTDTMAFTAAALAFMLEQQRIPVILTGAQRSSDRPSSDVHLNLLCAVRAACSDVAEVCIAMHGETEDTYVLLHRGVRAKKLHTSRRDAFVSVNDVPLAKIWKERIEFLRNDYKKRNQDKENRIFLNIEQRVALLKFFPGMPAELVDVLVDKGYKGLVIEGTGLGHVGEYLLPAIRRAVEEGLVVCMVSQCIWGRINMCVYSTGRKLLQAGVVPCEDMTAEAALSKLMYLLGKYDAETAKKLMPVNLKGEISERSSYLVSRPPKFYYHESLV